MAKIPTIETERLVLRPFTLNDAAEVQRLAGDRAITDTTMNIPHPYHDGIAEQWISGHAASFDTGSGLTLAVTVRRDDSLAGAVSLMGISQGHQAELGYWIAKQYWNHGYCTEAGHALLRFAFTDLGLERVHACHFARNPASGRVMQKLGMSREGQRRQHVRKWDTLEDLALYGILRHEWQAAANQRLPYTGDARAGE